MSLISVLQEFDGKEIGEDGSEPVIGKLNPGLSNRELQDLKASIPCPIPAHIEDVLKLSRGIEPSLELVDFSGLSLRGRVQFNKVLPHGLPIAGDGEGNFWLVDLNSHSKDWGPVFYLAQDPPVLVYQAKTFEEFLTQLIGFACFDENSAINLVHDHFASLIWRENPGLISSADAVQPGDPDLSRFALSLHKSYQYADLRRARTGDGFSWGRFGKDTEIRRDSPLRLFAVRKIPNWLQKLLGA